jgi:hypothetical protein
MVKCLDLNSGNVNKIILSNFFGQKFLLLHKIGN